MTFYICALPYPKRAGRIPELISSNPAVLEAFARRWDRPGYGVYECISPLQQGARRRSLETVAALVLLHSDIDLRTLQEPYGEVLQRLQRLPLPLEIRDSGGGFHPVLHLKEEVTPGTAEFERCNAARSRLNHVLCADPAPNHAAALLRRLGTHNFKYNGEPRPCRVIQSGRPVDITEVEELLDLLGDKPLFTPLPRQTNGHDRAEGPPRSAGPIDVEARLAAMTFKGHGDSSIHWTQVQCSASMLRAGVPVDDVVTQILAATRRAATGDPKVKTWNWAAEKHDVKKQCFDFINKNPELAATLPDALFAAWNERLTKGRTHLHVTYAPHIGWHVRSHEPKPDEPAEDKAQKTKTDGGSSPQWPTPYSGRAAAQIPLRNFALGQHYLIGATSITASGGGVGKSTLSLLEAVSFVVGRNLLTGETLERPRRAWVWNAEDDVDEMERRVLGVCAHYGIDRAGLHGWLFIDSGYELPLDLARGNGKGAVIDEKSIDLIATRVKERGIEIVALDPLVALHTMAETDNPGHAKLIRTLSTRLAKWAGCAVDINAHTRKPGIHQEGMTIDDVRGAGAIAYSARSGRILHPMTLAEAQKYDIEADDRFSYYRLERAKTNMAKRGTICWVRMIEVPIANGPEGAYGDTVAVPVVWTPPDAMEGVTDTIAAAIAHEIGQGEYKRDARAGASWAGRLVGMRCGIDIATKAGKERAKTILDALIRKGTLAVDIRYDKNRNSKEYVIPGALHAAR
jgi:AAA domain